MAQSHAGPVIMPWESGHYEEVAVFLLSGLLGAILGATILAHYRAHQGRGPELR
jgi:uncharacterized membrane protein YfcA